MMKNIRRKKDLGIYGLTAKWYDRNSRKSRLAEMQGYANEAAAHVSKGANILEVAPGPGYLSIELARKGFKVTGVEISPDFVKIEKITQKKQEFLLILRKAMHQTCLARIIILILLYAVPHLRISRNPLRHYAKCIECLKKGEQLS